MRPVAASRTQTPASASAVTSNRPSLENATATCATARRSLHDRIPLTIRERGDLPAGRFGPPALRPRDVERRVPNSRFRTATWAGLMRTTEAGRPVWRSRNSSSGGTCMYSPRQSTRGVRPIPVWRVPRAGRGTTRAARIREVRALEEEVVVSVVRVPQRRLWRSARVVPPRSRWPRNGPGRRRTGRCGAGADSWGRRFRWLSRPRRAGTNIPS